MYQKYFTTLICSLFVFASCVSRSSEEPPADRLLTSGDMKPFPDRVVAVISQDASGTAAKGYDMVALMRDGKALAGSSEHSFTYRGARWFFVSPQNRDEFARIPEAYLPEYGGYCSWSTANDSELPPSPGDPETFDVVEGRVYFKYNKIVQMLWRWNAQKYIRKADYRWPQFVKIINEHLQKTK